MKKSIVLALAFIISGSMFAQVNRITSEKFELENQNNPNLKQTL